MHCPFSSLQYSQRSALAARWGISCPRRRGCAPHCRGCSRRSSAAHSARAGAARREGGGLESAAARVCASLAWAPLAATSVSLTTAMGQQSSALCLLNAPPAARQASLDPDSSCQPYLVPVEHAARQVEHLLLRQAAVHHRLRSSGGAAGHAQTHTPKENCTLPYAGLCMDVAPPPAPKPTPSCT